MRVLFLDMDGVVNSARYFEVLSKRAYRKARGKAKAIGRSRETFVDMIDPETVPLLNAIVADGVSVVISSSWRIIWTRVQIAGMLRQRGFVGTIIGMTPNHVAPPAGMKHERGHEIQAWLTAHPEVESFVILDDSDDMAHLLPWLVRTNWADGLRPEHVVTAVSLWKRAMDREG